ncbi:TPA: hypothetical protein ACHJ2G_002461 [Escherichia coli]
MRATLAGPDPPATPAASAAGRTSAKAPPGLHAAKSLIAKAFFSLHLFFC